MPAERSPMTQETAHMPLDERGMEASRIAYSVEAHRNSVGVGLETAIRALAKENLNAPE
jgi:hypothetical protein